MQVLVKITREENAVYFHVQCGEVVAVELEDYVAGVVGSEIGNSALEACKAQAVAARTFAAPYVRQGKPLTDASSTHQAFRALRMNGGAYKNARQAAQETAGEVLTYGGQVLSTCSYSASNGGRTVSSAERWGGARPWLIAQDDPWDLAATGGRKTGHGVGMSQAGIKYAAKLGVGYRDMLAFYYPGTEIRKEEESQMNEKAKTTVEIAISQLGGPYVFGAWGSECTPSMRRKYAGYNPAHKNNIYKACQVLSGKADNCEGCKWKGRLAFDCRGFTHWILKQVGIDLSGSGATSQYNTNFNWAQCGTIDGMPDLPCCVFQQSGGKMQHTGYHIGGGRIIHCSAGVQEGNASDKGWTHYAVPVGLYEPEELTAAKVVDILPTLRRGSSGEAVKELQKRLLSAGLSVGANGADGVFGSATLAAVQEFQTAHGLTTDGICGPATWAALKEEAFDAMDKPDQPSQEPEGDAAEAVVPEAVVPEPTVDAAALLGTVDAAMEQLREAVKACMTFGGVS